MSYGPITELEVRLMLLRVWLRSDRNKMLAANAVLYAVGIIMVALVVLPR